MMDDSYPRIIFPDGFNEQSLFELPFKGWVNVKVLLRENVTYSVFFIDPTRLQQDLEELSVSGKPCFAEPGLVIVPEVSEEVIKASVQFLWRTNFFETLRPE